MLPTQLPIQIYQQRRQQLAQRMRALSPAGGVAMLTTAREVMRNRDSDYPYRFDSHFYYLSGFPEPEAILVVQLDQAAADGLTTTLFCRPKNIEREIWDGLRYGPEQAMQVFGIDQAVPIENFSEALPGLLANQAALFTPFQADHEFQQLLAKGMRTVRAQSRAGATTPTQHYDLHALLDEMRLFKDGHEISIMQRAAEISARAHRRAMQTVQAGKFEYEIEAELLHEFRRSGSQAPAYGSIVATGANACILHYRENNTPLANHDLLLIDAGCELDGYASDITRTFPVSGKFVGTQKALYEIVLAAQLAAIAQTRAGQRFIDPHQAALEVLVQGLLDEGLLQGSRDGILESGAYRQFYMHRTSHWLGMDVHDVGEYRETTSTALATAEKPWRVLQPGMVLTIEPGLYVRPADNVPEAYWNIGIRIEDDVLVTSQGAEILSKDAPKEMAEIEAVMQHGL